MARRSRNNNQILKMAHRPQTNTLSDADLPGDLQFFFSSLSPSIYFGSCLTLAAGTFHVTGNGRMTLV